MIFEYGHGRATASSGAPVEHGHGRAVHGIRALYPWFSSVLSLRSRTAEQFITSEYYRPTEY